MAAEIETGFMIVQSNRLEALRELTVEWLKRHPLPPLENEVLLVQSNGIAQWLKLALAEDEADAGGGCDIATALNISLPASYVWQVYRSVLGDLPINSAYDKQPLTWRLLRLLPSLMDRPEFLPLSRFLKDDHQQRKLFQLAQRLADLYDQYQVYRADWLDDWSKHVDCMSQKGDKIPLPEGQLWQAELWRQIIADMSEINRHTSRAQVHQRFLKTAITPDMSLNLPKRVVVFGISSLPKQTVQVLERISQVTQVLLCVSNPCQYFWGDIIDPAQSRRLFTESFKRHPLKWQTDISDEHLYLHANPLLGSWGKQGRDYIRLLDEFDQKDSYEEHFQQQKLSIDLFEEPGEDSLLKQLQSDILSLRSLEESKARPRSMDASDQSLTFHVAHSAQREVEILQDYLLGLFAQHPDLRPRDILVMVPDINQYAPHIRAVFGRIGFDDTRFIPFTLSDQGQRHQAPLLIALESLLNLPGSRFSVSEILDLLDVPALQAKFGITALDKPLLHHWIEDSGIRWGLDAHHRESFGLPPEQEQNTWRFGLKRMLLGYTLGQEDAWQDIEPYAEVGGLSATLAGALVRFIDRLDSYWLQLQASLTPPQWVTLLRDLCQDFFIAQDSRDELLLTRIELGLQTWQEHCEHAAFSDPLPLHMIRETILSQIDQTGLNQRFMAGAVNFATLMPMRAVPFQHICLLGMNESDYPRQVMQPDFDLMPLDYRAGDRSRREDDRYLFLEALLSARDGLYISWVGRNIRDNTELPPSVLIGQLRDHITTISSAERLQRVTFEYPLQPFSLAYFSAESPHRTYAKEWQDIHLDPSIMASDTFELPPLSSDAQQPISLAHLGQLLKVPAQAFFAERLGVIFNDPDPTGEDHEAFAIAGLEAWTQRQQLVESILHQLQIEPELDIRQQLQRAVMQQQRRGQLPLAPFGHLYAEELIAPLITPLTSYQQRSAEFPLAIQHSEQVLLEQGLLLLDDNLLDIRINSAGERRRLLALPSQVWQGKTLKWHHLVRQWPYHLAAQLKGETLTEILAPDTQLFLKPLDAQKATELLLQLMASWFENLQSPLPFSAKTSGAFIRPTKENSGLKEAHEAYHGNYQLMGEVQQNLALQRLWPRFEDLAQDGRFVDLSNRLFQPILDHLILNTLK